VIGVGWVPITISNIEVTGPYKNVAGIEFGVSKISQHYLVLIRVHIQKKKYLSNIVEENQIDVAVVKYVPSERELEPGESRANVDNSLGFVTFVVWGLGQ